MSDTPSYRVVNDRTDRAFKATHLCKLPDPTGFFEDALIACSDCHQLWAKHINRRGPYWDGIRQYENKAGLIRWRKYYDDEVPHTRMRGKSY